MEPALTATFGKVTAEKPLEETLTL